VTEFGADGAVTTTNVNKYAAHLAKEGCAGVFVNGTSGESMSLSVEERERLAAAWKRAGDLHGLKIVVHVGCDSTVDAARLAAHAEKIGCAGVSAMAPRFFKCGGAAQLAEYCAAIAGAAPRTPFLYYHFPMATGVPTKPSEFFAAAKPLIPTLAGMKFSDGNMWEYGDCCDADASGALAFMPGFEAQTLAYLPYHPRETFGAISLSFSVLAPLHARIADKFYGGEAADAHHLQAASRKFFRAVTDALRLDPVRQARARGEGHLRLAGLPRAVEEPHGAAEGRAQGHLRRPRRRGPAELRRAPALTRRAATPGGDGKH
jgi:N-acetylneuraminate lyase